MLCPSCNSKLNTLDTRACADNTTKRRLECPRCGDRFNTLEVIIGENDVPDRHQLFKQLAKHAVEHGRYISSLTGGMYATEKEAVDDTIKELERIYDASRVS